MRSALDPLNAVLGRIAEELEEIADRLSAVRVEGTVASDADAVSSWQEIDQSEQRARALATVVGRLVAQGGNTPIDLDALLAGIGLDAVTDRIRAHAMRAAASGTVDLF